MKSTNPIVSCSLLAIEFRNAQQAIAAGRSSAEEAFQTALRNAIKSCGAEAVAQNIMDAFSDEEIVSLLRRRYIKDIIKTGAA